MEVDHPGADARGVEPAQDDGERDEEHEDDDPGGQTAAEILQVPGDAHICLVVEQTRSSEQDEANAAIT